MESTALNKINESELFTKYKSSYKCALLDLSSHIFLMATSLYLLWLFRNSWFVIFIMPFMILMNARTLVVFHDCSHYSYIPSRLLNYIIGSVFGIFTSVPFCWSYEHAHHHIANGNLNASEIYDFYYNDLVTYTLSDYKKWNGYTRWLFKTIRNPFVYFICFPILYFGIRQRCVVLIFKILKKEPYQETILQILFDTLLSNIGIVIWMYYLYKIDILYIYICSRYITDMANLLFFYNEHTFNPCYVVSNQTWTNKDSSLKGTSLIEVPYYLKYFLNGVEYHHIHHLNTKIPGYNLQKYHEEVISKSNMFDNVVTLSIMDCCNNLWLVLYDGDNNKYITAKEADEEIGKNKNI